ncbi:MAG: hypothetical protein AAF483_23500, partial [Planctomycetota bacterium]
MYLSEEYEVVHTELRYRKQKVTWRRKTTFPALRRVIFALATFQTEMMKRDYDGCVWVIEDSDESRKFNHNLSKATEWKKIFKETKNSNPNASFFHYDKVRGRIGIDTKKDFAPKIIRFFQYDKENNLKEINDLSRLLSELRPKNDQKSDSQQTHVADFSKSGVLGLIRESIGADLQEFDALLRNPLVLAKHDVLHNLERFLHELGNEKEVHMLLVSMIPRRDWYSHAEFKKYHGKIRDIASKPFNSAKRLHVVPERHLTFDNRNCISDSAGAQFFGATMLEEVLSGIRSRLLIRRTSIANDDLRPRAVNGIYLFDGGCFSAAGDHFKVLLTNIFYDGSMDSSEEAKVEAREMENEPADDDELNHLDSDLEIHMISDSESPKGKRATKTLYYNMRKNFFNGWRQAFSSNDIYSIPHLLEAITPDVLWNGCDTALDRDPRCFPKLSDIFSSDSRKKKWKEVLARDYDTISDLDPEQQFEDALREACFLDEEGQFLKTKKGD